MQITQSLLKSLEQGCPRKVYDEFVDGHKANPNSHMVKGSYFETLAIGSGSQGMITTDLPRLKSGEKSVDQLRIEAQAQRFKDMFDPNHKDFTGKVIVKTQEKLIYGEYEGTLDFTTEPLLLYDLKLTENMDGYWSDTKSIDFVQQIFYRWLYERVYGVSPEIRLLIFEYSPQMRIKEIKINISEQATQTALSRFSNIQGDIAEYNEMDEWPRVPSLGACSKCPLTCNRRMVKENVLTEEIYL